MNIKKNYLPSKRSFVDNFLVMEVLAQSQKIQKTGRKIFHFELGEPIPRTPKKILNEAKRLINLNLPGYTPSNGIKELREKISEHYLARKIKVNASNIFITTGSSGAFLLTFLSCFDPGDRVVIFNPSYPAYRNILKSLNIEVIEINPSKNNLSLINLRKVKKYKNIKGIIISSPNNPNGQVFDYDELKFIYEYCKENSIRLISDEIYHGIEYGKFCHCLKSFGKDAIIINSFSKYFCMPGWRLGWVIVPDGLKENFLKLSQNLFISCGNIAQFSAIKSFECTQELKKNVEIYKKNRDFVVQKLNETSWCNFPETMGAFYIYIDVSKFTNDSQKLVKKVLNETGVALTSGIDFDKKNGKKTVRLSFSCDHKTLKEGMEKLSLWIKKNY